MAIEQMPLATLKVTVAFFHLPISFFHLDSSLLSHWQFTSVLSTVPFCLINSLLLSYWQFPSVPLTVPFCLVDSSRHPPWQLTYNTLTVDFQYLTNCLLGTCHAWQDSSNCEACWESNRPSLLLDQSCPLLASLHSLPASQLLPPNRLHTGGGNEFTHSVLATGQVYPADHRFAKLWFQKGQQQNKNT